MDKNNFLISLGILMIITFGGSVWSAYIKEGDILVEDIMMGIAGLVFLIGTLFWKIRSRKS